MALSLILAALGVVYVLGMSRAVGGPAVREWDGPVEPVPGQLPLIDTPEAAADEIRAIASEARALCGVDDEARRARFLARKRALLDYLERSTR